MARKVTKEGLYSNLYAAIRKEDEPLSYLEDFYQTVKAQSFSTLPGLSVFRFIEVINEFFSTKSAASPD